MHESHHLFSMLEPPAGGLRRLQHHVATTHPPQRRRELLLTAAFALSALVVGSLWLPDKLAQHRRDNELQHALQLAMLPPEHGVEVIGGGTIELPSGQTNARLYLVQVGGSTPLPAQ